MSTTTKRDILSSKLASIEWALDNVGVNPYTILDISEDVPYSMGAFEKNLGEISRIWERDPDTLTMRPMSHRRGNPEPITFPVSVTARANNKIEKLGDRDKFNLRWRGVTSGRAGDTSNYTRMDLFLDALLETIGSEGDMLLRDSDQGEEENIVINANVNAAAHFTLYPLNGSVISTGLAAMDDVDFRHGFIYDDGDDIHLYFVTDVDPTATTSYLLDVTVDRITGDVGTWTSYSLTGYTTGNDADFVVRSGDTVIVGSNGGAMVSYANVSDLSTWTTDSTTFAADAPNMAAVPYAGLIYVVCDGGSIFYSDDGGLSWTEEVVAGALTASNLAAVAFVNGNLGYAAGASGAILKYDSGDWSLLTDPTSGAGITCIAIPENRSNDVYLACDDGTIWKTHLAAVPDAAASWSQVRFQGDGSGSVDWIAFTMETFGPTFWVVHTNAGGSSRILRDTSGGAGTNLMAEEISGTDVSTNSGLVVLLPIDSNFALAGGNVHSTDEMVMKVA